MNENAAFDASIPVLTEVFQDAPAPAAKPDGAAAPGAAIPLEFTEQDWEALERRVAERVLRQLQGRVDFVLEARLRDSLGEIVRQALGPLTDEIRAGLHETLSQTLSRAVTAEIAHLKAQKAKTN